MTLLNVAAEPKKNGASELPGGPQTGSGSRTVEGTDYQQAPQLVGGRAVCMPAGDRMAGAQKGFAGPRGHLLQHAAHGVMG